jgi:hypothetical protein
MEITMEILFSNGERQEYSIAAERYEAFLASLAQPQAGLIILNPSDEHYAVALHPGSILSVIVTAEATEETEETDLDDDEAFAEIVAEVVANA